MNENNNHRFKHKYFKLFLLIYFIALIISHIVRISDSPLGISHPEHQFIELNEVDGDNFTDNKVIIAYREYFPSANKNAPTLVLLHGSPVASNSLNNLIAELKEKFHLIVPDLPGFGGSTLDISDYSVRAHAYYLKYFLEIKKISRAHFFAYSQSGGVVLNLSEIAPQIIQSVIFASAIGVAEYELFYNEIINKSALAFQLAAIWIAQELIPHFGWMDTAILNIPYARNFYDSDRISLRSFLQQLSLPMLILHGENDNLVPLAVANENFRIVPQSELEVFQDNHMMVINRPQKIVPFINKFISKVETGKSTNKSSAISGRLVDANKPFDNSNAPPFMGIAYLVVMLVIILATLVSEDLTCIGAGYLAANGSLGFTSAIVACFCGIVIGDILLYAIGRWTGFHFLNRAPLKWFISQSAVERSKQWLSKKGPVYILVTRFIPGTRLPFYYASGALKAPFWVFAFYFCLASAVWVPLLVFLAMILGSQMLDYYINYQANAIYSLIVLAFVLYSIIHILIPLFTYRGRRILISKWCRFWQWEFWPLWKFYPPIVFYVLWLGLKNRCLTLFTISNPGIPHSGFIGEKKSEILDNLKGASDSIAQWCLIKCSEKDDAKFSNLKLILNKNNLDYPLVFKPDEGQRGLGVKIIQNFEEAKEYINLSTVDTIIQEFIDGFEVGIFYYRYPDEPSGHIFSITEKKIPYIIGDGVRTIEQLILDDERAVCMAPFYLDSFHEKLFDVAKKDEKISLTDVGTHCRGAIFLDGDYLITEGLTQCIDEISKKFDGFYFGRYDIKTPGKDDLKKGENLKVIELNGVTSEATSIYDPKNSLIYAYKKLMKQWEIAFKISKQNLKKGHKPVTVRELFDLFIQASSRQREID